jgi:RNA polymerase sigma-70 factor (ECF subfamily)
MTPSWRSSRSCRTPSPARDGYFYFHGARGAFLLELARAEEARIAFDRAIALAHTPAEAAYIRNRIDQLIGDGRGDAARGVRQGG